MKLSTYTTIILSVLTITWLAHAILISAEQEQLRAEIIATKYGVTRK